MRNENGSKPANPTPYQDLTNGSGEMYCDNDGLTKREHFAAMALSSVLDKYNPYESGDFDSSDWDCVAKNAVGIADALLKELANETV